MTIERHCGTNLAAKQLIDGNAKTLAQDVPQRTIDSAERVVPFRPGAEIFLHVSRLPNVVDLVAGKMPDDPDPLRDIVFIMRTGALFPVYRTFSLLEQLTGRVIVPTVLFYPGDLDGAAGLRFMGVLAAEHNYRPKIF